jgi:hypothetical protein
MPDFSCGIWVDLYVDGNNARVIYGSVGDSTGQVTVYGTVNEAPQVVFHEDGVCVPNVGPS